MGAREYETFINCGSCTLAPKWACTVRCAWKAVLVVHNYDFCLEGVGAGQQNLGSAADFERTLDNLCLNLIVYTSVIAHVDTCDADRFGAFNANAFAVELVARVAQEKTVSTLHFYIGSLCDASFPLCTKQTRPWPLNMHPSSKLAAENLVMPMCPAALILRTNFFCWGCAYSQPISDWITSGLRAGTELQLCDDVFFTSIFADKLVRFADKLNGNWASGVFNVVGSQSISKYDFGGAPARSLGLPAGRIQPGKISNAHLLAKRSKNMPLGKERLVKPLGRSSADLHQSFEQLHLPLRQGRRFELMNAVSKREAVYD